MMGGVAETIDSSSTADKALDSGIPLKWVLAVACVLGGIMWMRSGPRASLAAEGWGSDWDQAVVSSQQTGKPALVLFTADWCPACRQFESQVLSRTDVKKFLADRYTLVVVDVTDPASANSRRAQQFRVDGIPTLIVYDQFGREAARNFGMPADALFAWLGGGGR